MTEYVPLFFDIETTGLNPCQNKLVCVGIGTFHDWKAEEPTKVIDVIYGEDEYFLLKNVRKAIVQTQMNIETEDGIGSDKEIYLVGFYNRNFDHPFLVGRFSRYRQNPEPFCYKRKRLDVKRVYGRGSQDKIAEQNGIDVVDDIEGSEIPGLFELGREDEIKSHCREDLRVLMELFMKRREDCVAHLYNHYKDIEEDVPVLTEVKDV